MSRRLAASITVLPAGTEIFVPSTVSSIICAFVRHQPRTLNIVGDPTAAVFDVMLELVAKVLDERAHRQRCRVTQSADGAPDDVLGDRIQQVQILRLALSVLDPVHHPVQPSGALTAGSALTTRLLIVKIRQALQ